MPPEGNNVEIARLQEQIRGIRDQQKAHSENTEKLFDKLFDEIDQLKAAMNRGKGIFTASITLAGAPGASAAALVEYLTWGAQVTDRDTDILARTLVGEARGEGKPGMSDVACVVMNRVQVAQHYVEAHGRPHPLFGDGSAASACLAREQFSCWNEGDPNRAVIEALDDTIPIFDDAIAIAGSAVDGTLPDRTGGATHYERIGTSAAWAEGKTPCFTEGHHEFFNDIS